MDPGGQIFPDNDGGEESFTIRGGGDANETVVKKKLFTAAMQGKWEEVVSIYTANSSIRGHKITHSGDTVLHVAVESGKKDIIKRLLSLVTSGDENHILNQKNVKENTPLHLAAALGMADVCGAMATKCPELIVKARNNLGETPLFVAARHGKIDAFFALQSIVESKPAWYNPAQPPETIPSYCRRQYDGNTILHVAVTFEHLELAFKIIKLYHPLVDSVNVRGERPLHCLANKPEVFASSSRFGIIDKLIFHCTFVPRMEFKYSMPKDKVSFDVIKIEDRTQKLRDNYKICLQVYELLKHGCNTLFPSFNCQSWKECCFTNIKDEENPGGAGVGQSEQQNQETNYFSARRFFPENYGTCIEMLQVAVKFLLIVLGIGFWRIEEVQKKKRKHEYACQIMNELVDSSRSWEYDGNRPDAVTDALSAHQNQPPPVDAAQPPSVDEENQPSTSEAQMQATSTTTVPETSWNLLLDSLSKAAKEDVVPKNIIILGQGKDASSPILGQDKGASTPIKAEDKPILVAAMRGVTEMVEKILDTFPVAIQDTDDNDKNIVLLAVEHRQPNVYKLMLKRNIMKENVFGKVDKKGNSALHLAATLGQTRPWIISGAALQMQWEIKWFKYVQKSMDPEFFQQRNNDGKTARDIFTEMHEPLVKDGGIWLADTSKSCSVVAALIATVAFASATTVPGGIDNKSGLPLLEGQVAFQIFALSALVALNFSVTSLIMFLSILTSRYQEMDFESGLPVKMIFGLTSLFLSIGSMLVSFCSGNFFVVEKKLDYVTYPIYAVMGVPVSFFAIAQFPLYVDLIRATFARVPERTEKVQTHG